MLHNVAATYVLQVTVLYFISIVSYLRHYFALFFVDPPKLTVKPLSQQVVEGNEVTLFCNSTGNPPPSTAWTKQRNNTVLSSSETLLLTNLMRGDNGEVYNCKVQNILGSDETTATISVLCEYSVFKQKQKI